MCMNVYVYEFQVGAYVKMLSAGVCYMSDWVTHVMQSLEYTLHQPPTPACIHTHSVTSTGEHHTAWLQWIEDMFT